MLAGTALRAVVLNPSKPRISRVTRSSYPQKNTKQSTNEKHRKPKETAHVNRTRVHPDQGAFLDKSPVCHAVPGRCAP